MSSPSPYRPLPQQGDYSIDLRVLYFALTRRWRLIAGITLLCLMLGVLYIALQPPLYTANTVLQINVQDQSMMNMEATQQSRFPESSNAINSELDVIRSRTVARRVIAKLGLLDSPEFNPNANESLPPLKKLKLYVKDMLGLEQQAASEEETLIHVTSNVLEGLAVSMDSRSYIVTVNYTSESPRQAQLIANAFAEEYLSYQIESRYDSNQRATDWLSKNVGELRSKAIESAKAVQKFSEENNLYQLNGRTISDQQMEQLNAQMVQEEAALAQTQARLERARQLRRSKEGINSVPEVLNSALISSLRQQEATLLRDKSELTSQFGPKHPKMNFIDNQIAELNAKIDDEINKIVKGIENEMAIARERISFLQQRIDNQQSTFSGTKRQEVELEELRREAEANAELYKTMLAGMKETGEAGNMKQVNAKIISKADLPLKSSHPRKLLILVFALAFGLCAGCASALLLEFMGQGFITLQAVEDNLGLPGIAMVPETSKQQILADYASQHPASIYAESLRMINASLQEKRSDNRAKTIMIISSLPDEGKGWLATSLARVIAKSGKRVLLLDCDLHQSLSLHPNSNAPVKTLNDYLAGKAQPEDIIQSDSFSGMHYIGSSPDKRNIQELLDSAKMQQLMERIRDVYDLVILDAPPVLGMSDVLFLSKFADTALLVVRWLKTPRQVVENSLRILSHAKVGLTGVVLSRVDLGYYKKHAFGKKMYYDKFVDYYQPAA